VIENPDLGPYLLPTQGGFFFGDTSYNKWYIKDLIHTVDVCETAINLIEDGWRAYYRASW
jgi:hypothetical protein